jgi:arylsulfatase A
LTALVGRKLPGNACPDSFNVLPALLGEVGAKGRDHLVQQANGLALREGDWKLIRHRNKKYALYNLAEDPGETKDVIDNHPDRAEKMKIKMEKIETDGRSRS